MAKKKEPPKFKKGQKVMWQSQAGGVFSNKVGTIVAVCTTPTVDLAPKDRIELISKARKCSIKTATEINRHVSLVHILMEMFNLKFSPYEGYREGDHYLVSVPRDGNTKRKPYLYHPITSVLKPVK